MQTLLDLEYERVRVALKKSRAILQHLGDKAKVYNDNGDIATATPVLLDHDEAVDVYLARKSVEAAIEALGG